LCCALGYHNDELFEFAMKKLISEWLWRVAIVCTLGWIGFELHQIHEAMLEPLGETTTATAPEDLQDSIDATPAPSA